MAVVSTKRRNPPAGQRISSVIALLKRSLEILEATGPIDDPKLNENGGSC